MIPFVKYAFISLVAACSILGEPSYETLPDTSLQNSTFINDIHLCITNTAAIVTEPLHFSWQQWLIASGVIGGTMLSFLADNHVKNYAKSHRLSKEKYLLDAWQIYGSPYMLAVGAGLYIAGIGFSKPLLQETGREALFAMVTAEAITLTLKIIFGRLPPSGNNSPKDFNFFEFHRSAWAFPSGHTTIAFAIFLEKSERISNPYITIVLYTTAFMVGLERVYNRKHWFSDAIMGAAVGTAIGKIVVKSSVKSGSPDKQWEFLPRISSNTLGLKITYNPKFRSR